MKTKGLGSLIKGSDKKSGLGSGIGFKPGEKKTRGSGGNDKSGLGNMLGKKK
jgi:hypothetical protein